MNMSLFFLLFASSFFAKNGTIDFLTEQKKHHRVKTAINEKLNIVEKKLSENGLRLTNFELLMVAYKDVDVLEIYAKKKSAKHFKCIVTYPICARSGSLGPKRKQGDAQVPEGFYYIQRFNPISQYYLSLGLNYPNLSDRKKSNATNLGGDIFIHGDCVTIGCLPMTNELIKEIYLYAIYAKNNGQDNIPVYIFPFKMANSNMKIFSEKFKHDKNLLLFWENLKIGYDKFTENYQKLNYSVSAIGDYVF